MKCYHVFEFHSKGKFPQYICVKCSRIICDCGRDISDYPEKEKISCNHEFVVGILNLCNLTCKTRTRTIETGLCEHDGICEQVAKPLKTVKKKVEIGEL